MYNHVMNDNRKSLDNAWIYARFTDYFLLVKLTDCVFKFERKSDLTIGCMTEIISQDKYEITHLHDPHNPSNAVKIQSLNARNLEELLIELELRNLVTFI